MPSALSRRTQITLDASLLMPPTRTITGHEGDSNEEDALWMQKKTQKNSLKEEVSIKVLRTMIEYQYHTRRCIAGLTLTLFLSIDPIPFIEWGLL